MAETPKKKSKQSLDQTQNHSPSNSIPIPPTPQAPNPTPLRRSSRLLATPATATATVSPYSTKRTQSPLVPSGRKSLDFTTTNTPRKSAPKNPKTASKPISPISPDRIETRRKRKIREQHIVGCGKDKVLKGGKKRVYYRKVVYDGAEFSIGNDVYVKRREDAESDNEDPEVEECVVCFKAGTAVMIECDECLGGFHLNCLKPPLKEVPEGDWICGFCEAKKMGKNVEFHVPPQGKKRARTAKEKLLSSDLWAAHIERFRNYIYILLYLPFNLILLAVEC